MSKAKLFLISIVVVFFSLHFGNNAMAIEKSKYTVIESDGSFEIRQYEGQIVAETYVDGDLEDAGDAGFRRLFDYISGNNRRKQSIDMTAPVTQQMESEKIAMTAPVGQERANGQWRITFMMPAEYTLDSLPEPLDPAVQLKQEPARKMAAIKYSGRWTKEGYEKNKARLEEWIQQRGLEVAGEPVWARYDPPFMPWFLRRNEVLVPIE